MLSNVVDTITASDDALLDEMACSITGDNPLPRELVTGFTYAVVMCQVEKTTFKKTDRERGGNRKHISIGRNGLRCKHCKGVLGLRTGRYFASSLKTFSDPMKTLACQRPGYHLIHQS